MPPSPLAKAITAAGYFKGFEAESSSKIYGQWPIYGMYVSWPKPDSRSTFGGFCGQCRAASAQAVKGIRSVFFLK